VILVHSSTLGAMRCITSISLSQGFQTIDFLLSAKRDAEAVKRFFEFGGTPINERSGDRGEAVRVDLLTPERR
jgi:transposase-like protein